MIKAIVFDLGGTLMEYKGMPLNWEEYYPKGLQNVNRKNGLNLKEEHLQKTLSVLKACNPRNSRRENEIAPEVIFEDATASWPQRPDIRIIIEDFFEGMALEARIFDYTEELIRKCKAEGLKVACLTDLPSGMPDPFFRRSITELEPLLDLYVSSQTCGFRKPNPKGLRDIADCFGIELSEILFIGDEKKDEETARNAGCKFEYINTYLRR